WHLALPAATALRPHPAPEDSFRVDPSSELDEGFFRRFCRAVDVEVIGIHGGDDGDVGIQSQEASVVFVGFNHTHVAIAAPEIGTVVYCNSTEEGVATKTSVAQQMRYH